MFVYRKKRFCLYVIFFFVFITTKKRNKGNNYLTIIRNLFVFGADGKHFSYALVLSFVFPSQTYISATPYQKVQSLENVWYNILRLNLTIFYIL